MNDLLQDIRFGARMLIRSPGMTLAAVLTVALGVGANTAIFSGVNGIFINPIPGVERSSELVEFYVTDASRGFMQCSSPEYRDYRDRNEVFSGLLAYGFFPMYMADGQSNERVWSLLASGNYFDVLGVHAAHGRTFSPGDDAPGAAPVVVISYGLWQRRFAGDPAVVGKTVALNSRFFTIVGVTPPEFRGTIPGLVLDAWVPLANEDSIIHQHHSEDRSIRWLALMGRLRPGNSLAAAEARLNLVARDLARAYSHTNAGLTASIFPPSRSPTGAPALMGSMLILVMSLTGLLLLITCANVANLLLSKATARQKEIAVRMALGAGRGRLVRQLLVESLELALLGGLAGLLVGYWTSVWLGGFFPETEFPIDTQVRWEPSILLFALGITAVSGLLFGAVPALQTTRSDLVAKLKDDAAGAIGGPGRSRLRNTLVVAQIAFSLVLLVAAGLFLRSLLNAQTVETGFNPRNVLLSTIFLPSPGYNVTRGTQFYRQLLERIETLPRVSAATLVRRAPLGLGGTSSDYVTVEGYAPKAGERPWSYVNNISSGYFRTLGVPLVRGREFDFHDDEKAARVAVINETMAGLYWKGRDPIGQRIQLDNEWLTIIGIVREFKARQLKEPPAPFLFISVMQFYRSYMTLLVRTASDPAAMAPAVRRIIREMDAQLPLYSVRTLKRHIEAASFPQRAAASFLGLFGIVALLLAAVGIYGVMAYSAAQRTREIGIRIALGAQNADVLRLMMRQGAQLTLAGVVLGLAGALAVTRFLTRFLLGVDSRDAATFAGVTVLLAAVALVACYLPARRATRVNPVQALRHD